MTITKIAIIIYNIHKIKKNSKKMVGHHVENIVECARKLVEDGGHLPTQQSQPILFGQNAFVIEPDCT